MNCVYEMSAGEQEVRGGQQYGDGHPNGYPAAGAMMASPSMVTQMDQQTTPPQSGAGNNSRSSSTSDSIKQHSGELLMVSCWLARNRLMAT